MVIVAFIVLDVVVVIRANVVAKNIVDGVAAHCVVVIVKGLGFRVLGFS